MEQLYKLFNLTPHSFIQDLNPCVDVSIYEEQVMQRVLPADEEEYIYVDTGAFVIGFDEGFYLQLIDDMGWEQHQLKIIKKLCKTDRLIRPDVTSFSKKDECEYLNLSCQGVRPDCVITSESITHSENSKNNFSTIELINDSPPKAWRKIKIGKININFDDVTGHSKNFLKFAPNIDVWDNHLHPDGYGYADMHKFFREIGSSNNKVEVTINKNNSTVFDEVDNRAHAESYFNYFKQFSSCLTGVDSIELRLWDEVHDRGVFCASLGGFELGLGLQDRGKGDDKEQNYIGWSPNEVEDRFSNYDISNNKDRKNHARWEVYPSLFQR